MSFNVNVLTPSRVLAKDLAVESLLIPTTQGMINVLKDHTHLVSKIDAGVLTCFTSAGKKSFVLTTGICKIMGEEIVILTNVGEESESLDVERAEAALTKAKEQLKKTDNLSSEEIVKYQRKLQRAELRIKAAKAQ